MPNGTRYAELKPRTIVETDKGMVMTVRLFEGGLNAAGELERELINIRSFNFPVGTSARAAIRAIEARLAEWSTVSLLRPTL